MSFVEQPEDVYVKPNNSANFSCIHDAGRDAIISWSVNEYYYGSTLPLHHSVLSRDSGEVLTVSHIALGNNNGSVYDCIVTSRLDNDMYIISQPGVIYVGEY